MRTKRASAWAVALGVVVATGAGVSFGQGCPEVVGRWPYGPASTVAVSGSTAYLGSGAVLVVLDVSSPAAPTVLGEVYLPSIVLSIAVAGSYAYVADSDAGLRVVDVSNPSSPFEVGSYDTPGYAYGVAVDGAYTYVAANSAGLEILVSCEGLIFQDGFESGDAGAWSQSVP